MTAYVSTLLRRLVIERAGGYCEYCLLPMAFATHAHEPDHVIPIQHGGTSAATNLALACFRCNRNKGPNIGSFDPVTGQLTPFFNPRRQQWVEHFIIKDGEILPLTAEGRVTIKILQFNTPIRVEERRRLQQLGVYPLFNRE